MDTIIRDRLPSIELENQDGPWAPLVLKNREFIPEDVSDVLDEDENDDDTLRKAAELLRNCLTEETKQKREFQGNVSLTRDEIPTKLFSFIKVLLGGTRESVGVRGEKVVRDVISVSNVIINSFRTDRQIQYNPKEKEKSCFKSRIRNNQSIALGISIRQHGRRKEVVDLLHKFNVVISNKHCLYWETSIANAVLANIEKNQGYYLPPGIQKNVFISFHIDNAVFQVQTLDGQSTIDTLNIAGFQKLKFTDVDHPPMDLNQTCRSQTLEKKNIVDKVFIRPPILKNFKLPIKCTSDEYTRRLTSDVSAETCMPWILCKIIDNVFNAQQWVSSETMLKVNLVENEGEENEIDFNTNILVDDAHSPYFKNDDREYQYRSLDALRNLDKLSIPPWSAFYSRVSSPDKYISSIFRFPLVPGPSIDHSSIYTALMQAQHITTWTNSSVKKL